MRSPRSPAAGTAAALVLAVLLLTFAGCGGGSGGGEARAPEPAAVDDPRLVVVALGDSLGRGVQPDPAKTAVHGYDRVLTARLRRRIEGGVRLVEAACGGATTESMMVGGKPCAPDLWVPYPNRDEATSQLRWAVRFLRDRGDLPTIVTLTIGGNDVIGCMTQDARSVGGCLATGFPAFRTRLKAIVGLLGQAAGERTVLVGSTLYDPFLGALRTGAFPADAVRVMHAAITGQVNPLIRRVLERDGWRLADLGRAAGEDGSVDGPDAAPVRTICATTWACTGSGDVHLNDAGYAAAARLFEVAAGR